MRAPVGLVLTTNRSSKARCLSDDVSVDAVLLMTSMLTLCSCVRSSNFTCQSADDWDPMCMDLCTCSGYMTLAAKASAVLMALGLIISCAVLRESRVVNNEVRWSGMHHLLVPLFY